MASNFGSAPACQMATLETFNFSLEDKMAGQRHRLGYCVEQDLMMFSVTISSHPFPLLMTWSELQFFWAAQLKQIIIACQQACTIRGPRWSHSRKENQSFSLVASVWNNTKLVSFLSTQSNPVGDYKVNRKQRNCHWSSNSTCCSQLQKEHGQCRFKPSTS